MSELLKYLLSSKDKLTQNTSKLPPLSMSTSIKNSPKHKRSRLHSYKEDPTAYATSRIDLTHPVESIDYEYKDRISPVKYPKLKLPENTERSMDGSPSLISAQTLKFKYPSMVETLKRNPCFPICQYIEENINVLSDIIKKKDLEKLIYFFNYPIKYTQEQNLLKVFSELLFLVSQFANTVQQLNKAAFLLKDCLTLSELIRDHSLKIRVLIQCFSIAKQQLINIGRLKQYEQARQFIYKALSYTWGNDLDELEMDCYDKLGICYFYMGNINKANYFHNKWTSAEIEPRDSYYRITSKNFIKLYEKNLPFCKDFDENLQRRLHIPFINIATGDTFDSKATLKYNTCQAQALLEKILQGKDFVEHNIEYHYIDKQQKRKVKKAQLPRRIVEITQKYEKNSDKYKFDHKIHDNPIYKLSLEEKVKYRKTKSYSLDQVYLNVKKFVGEQREPFKKSDQVYVKESQRKDLNPQNADQLFLTFKNSLMQILNCEYIY